MLPVWPVVTDLLCMLVLWSCLVGHGRVTPLIRDNQEDMDQLFGSSSAQSVRTNNIIIHYQPEGGIEGERET